MIDSKPAGDQDRELLGWVEFCCWTTLALTPVIYWLQGPSVSHDQFVVRTALVILSAAGGVGSRVFRIVQGVRSRKRGVEKDVPMDVHPKSEVDS